MRHVSPLLLIVLTAVALSLPPLLNFGAASCHASEAVNVPESINRFAIDLYAELGIGDDNLFFSPYSISSTLAMTYRGARGGTADQMRGVMHFMRNDEQLHSGFARLIGDVNREGTGGRIEINVANALWGQAGYRFKDDFLGDNQRHYKARLQTLDFKSDPEASRLVINRWIEVKTRDRIKDLIPQGVINSSSRLVLTNAIYFKGNWKFLFAEDGTRDGDFTLVDGETARVPLMSQTGSFGYFEQDDLQVLSLPYQDGKLRMALFLPRIKGAISGFEQRISYENMDSWLRSLDSDKERVDVTIPRFKITGSFSLAAQLTSMGMTDAFDRARADFSGMTGNRDLFISAVVHKAFIEVNEEGTEAAAATGVVIEALSARAEPEKTFVFRADHPFFFVIQDAETGAILFMGRVMNPLS